MYDSTTWPLKALQGMKWS